MNKHVASYANIVESFCLRGAVCTLVGCANVTRWRRSTLPLRALHHLLGHALSAALLPLLLHQLLQLRLAGVDAALVGGAAHHRLQHGHRRGHGALPDLTRWPVSSLQTHQFLILLTVD